MDLSNYNLDKIEVEVNDFSPLPEGWYPAQVETDLSGNVTNGAMVKYQMSILGDNYKGRKVFPSFMTKFDTNRTAESIGRSKLKQMMKACKKENMTDSHELVGFCCKVKVIQEEFNGKIYNKVTGFDYLDPEVVSPVAETKEADVPFWFLMQR